MSWLPPSEPRNHAAVHVPAFVATLHRNVPLRRQIRLRPSGEHQNFLAPKLPLDLEFGVIVTALKTPNRRLLGLPYGDASLVGEKTPPAAFRGARLEIGELGIVVPAANLVSCRVVGCHHWAERDATEVGSSVNGMIAQTPAQLTTLSGEPNALRA